MWFIETHALPSHAALPFASVERRLLHRPGLGRGNFIKQLITSK